MTTEIKKEKKLWKYFWIIKNYIFLVFWIVYFWYYFSPKYLVLENYIKEHVIFWEILLKYSNAIMAFFLVLWIIWILNRILHIILKKIVNNTSNDIDNVFVDYLNRFIKSTQYFIWLYIATKFLIIPEVIQSNINQIFSIIFLVIFLYFITSFINVTFESVLIKKTRFKTLNKTLLSFIKKIIIVVTWVIWIITILSNLGYNVTALITWAWIWGLAIALAAQQTLSNVFWAITVLVTKPFKIWDFVKIDNQIWTIKEIWISHLTMVDREWYYVLIPNEKLITNNIENLTKRETRRTEFSIWIEYSTTWEKTKQAIEIIEKILEKHKKENALTTSWVNFDTFWDFSLNIKITYFSIINDDFHTYLKQREIINLEIKEEFEKESINMAFPTQEVIIRK